MIILIKSYICNLTFGTTASQTTNYVHRYVAVLKIGGLLLSKQPLRWANYCILVHIVSPSQTNMFPSLILSIANV